MADKTTGFIVVAEFEVSLANRREFLELCEFDSKRSVADEPGCQQFDVNTSDESLETILLYEVYDDKASFDVHLTMPHYTEFALGVERLGVNKTRVRFFSRQYS